MSGVRKARPRARPHRELPGQSEKGTERPGARAEVTRTDVPDLGEGILLTRLHMNLVVAEPGLDPEGVEIDLLKRVDSERRTPGIGGMQLAAESETLPRARAPNAPEEKGPHAPCRAKASVLASWRSNSVPRMSGGSISLCRYHV